MIDRRIIYQTAQSYKLFLHSLNISNQLAILVRNLTIEIMCNLKFNYILIDTEYTVR